MGDKVQRADQEENALLTPLPFPPVTPDLMRESVAETEIAEQLVVHSDAFKFTLKNHMRILQ